MTPLLEFAAARIGRVVDAPGGEGGQCVDLVELWTSALGAERIPGNAVDLYANAAASQWQKVSNGPSNYPAAGDIVIWGKSAAVGISAYGHCSICLVADAWWLLTLDQNWPPGAPVAVVLHPYTGVKGWLRRTPAR